MRLSLTFTLLFISCSLFAQTKRITFKADKFYPEGIAFNETGNTFFTGSVKTGTIGTVDSNGAYRDLYVDSSLKSSFGMKTDHNNKHLWVCTGDPNYSIYSTAATHKKMIRLIALDIATGKKVKDIDLSNLYQGKHFANDLAFDNDGNIYITDSYSPVIYKVDKNGSAFVFAESEHFKSPDVGLNGIVWHKAGYLLVVNNSNGSILKVSTQNPAEITKVKINNFFPGADGLLWDKDGNLVLVQNKGVNKVFTIASTDAWNSAAIKAATASEDLFQNPSTCTMKNGKICVLNSKLNELQDPSITPSKEFSIQLAVMKPVM